MGDTLGSLIDKLSIVNLKMWNAQENFYEIRHMTFEEFKDKFFSDEGMLDLYTRFKKGIDLNLQRNILIDEIDKIVIEIVQTANLHESLDKFIQKKYKSY